MSFSVVVLWSLVHIGKLLISGAGIALRQSQWRYSGLDLGWWVDYLGSSYQNYYWALVILLGKLFGSGYESYCWALVCGLIIFG